MMVSERAAAGILGAVGLTREQARVLLRTGVAGTGERVATARLYDESRVRDVAGRPPVDGYRLREACPAGVFVARLSRDRALDVTARWEDQVRAVAPQPVLPPMAAAVVGVRWRMAGGRLPWVATVSGFVVLGGEATGWRSSEEGRSEVELAPPGSWYEDVGGHWFAFGRGRHWCLWDPWRLQQ